MKQYKSAIHPTPWIWKEGFFFRVFAPFFNNLSLWRDSAKPIRDNTEHSLKWIGNWMLSWFGSHYWARVLLKPPLIEISREGPLWGAFVCESFLGDWCKIFTASAALLLWTQIFTSVKTNAKTKLQWRRALVPWFFEITGIEREGLMEGLMDWAQQH